MEMGIMKAPLILRLPPAHSLSVPYCMTADIMHVAGNISDLLISLWQGTINCNENDNFDEWDWAVLADERTWAAYGDSVQAAGIHLPGMFGTWPHCRDWYVSVGVSSISPTFPESPFTLISSPPHP